MRKILLALLFFVSAPLAAKAEDHPKPAPQPAPFYRISFRHGDPVSGVSASSAIQQPFECTSDGTVFANMLFPAAFASQLSNASADGQPPARSPRVSPYSMPAELVSISPDGEAHDFRLDQIPDLYDVNPKGQYASESKIAFLVIAATEDKQGKQEFATSDGAKHEITKNLAEHQDYLIIFDRKGNYQKTVRVDDVMAIHRMAVFPSGAFLAWGFDPQDHSPKLAVFKDDGTLLRFVEIPKKDAPASLMGTQNDSGKGPAVFVRPVQLVPHGDSIVVVQNKSKFPLLEVSEAGTVRPIRPKLPEGVQVKTLIPSDENLYAQADDVGGELIYELNAQDGSILKRFQIDKREQGAGVACIHDNKFLSFEPRDGKLVPRIGTADPALDPTALMQTK
jgi:hypothetical protein